MQIKDFSGFLKGTAVEMDRGFYRIQQNTDVSNVLTVNVKGDKTYSKPLTISWYWSPFFYTIRWENDFLKLGSEQKLRTSHGWFNPTEIKIGTGVVLSDGRVVNISSVIRENVLAPVCKFVFPIPVCIVAKRVYLQTN
jgi:hypothetical protein